MAVNACNRSGSPHLRAGMTPGRTAADHPADGPSLASIRGLRVATPAPQRVRSQTPATPGIPDRQCSIGRTSGPRRLQPPRARSQGAGTARLSASITAGDVPAGAATARLHEATTTQPSTRRNSCAVGTLGSNGRRGCDRHRQRLHRDHHAGGAASSRIPPPGRSRRLRSFSTAGVTFRHSPGSPPPPVERACAVEIPARKPGRRDRERRDRIDRQPVKQRETDNAWLLLISAGVAVGPGPPRRVARRRCCRRSGGCPPPPVGPSVRAIDCHARAVRSAMPPGANGTTRVTGRSEARRGR